MAKILIVEDNSQDRYLLEMLLKGYGYEVRQAGNGVEALELARKEPPDIIISDIMMPGMDGFSLCREWKKDEKLKTIPFVFYTATYITQKDEKFAMGIGAERFIVKPQEPAAFIAELREVIEEYKAGKFAVPKISIADDTEYLRQYNEVLVQKLEKKIKQLQEEIAMRMQGEEALRKNEESYRTLVENINLGVCLIDKDYKLITTNSAFCKMFGIKKDEIIGKHCFEICHKNSSPCPHCPGTESMTSKKAVRVESECLCADGTPLPVILHTYPVFGSKNNAIAFIKISEDITEYKKVERAKKNLIRDMSHSLKTPIAVTEMAFDIIKKSVDSDDKESIRKANRIASENLAKLRKDVNNILQEFSIDVHKDVIGKDRKVSLALAMTKIADFIKSTMELKGLKLEINLSADADKIKIKKRDLETILNNILDNAIKFTDKGKISVTSRRKGEMVDIEVKDTGCGISTKDITRVFDKFYKRHAAIEGTGLGLSICKELVEMYDGEINIYSEGVGKGTVVVVHLPSISTPIP